MNIMPLTGLERAACAANVPGKRSRQVADRGVFDSKPCRGADLRPSCASASRLTVQRLRRLRREACGGDSCGSARREARVHASPRLGQP